MGRIRISYAVSFRRALWWCFREGYLMTYENIAKLFINGEWQPVQPQQHHDRVQQSPG